jgi:hypothetical protein
MKILAASSQTAIIARQNLRGEWVKMHIDDPEVAEKCRKILAGPQDA